MGKRSWNHPRPNKHSKSDPMVSLERWFIEKHIDDLLDCIGVNGYRRKTSYLVRDDWWLKKIIGRGYDEWD